MSYITQEGWRSLNFEVFISILLMRPKRKEGVSLVGSKFVLNVKKKHYSNSKIRTLIPLLISLYVFYIKSESISSPEQNYFARFAMRYPVYEKTSMLSLPKKGQIDKLKVSVVISQQYGFWISDCPDIVSIKNTKW